MRAFSLFMLVGCGALGAIAACVGDEPTSEVRADAGSAADAGPITLSPPASDASVSPVEDAASDQSAPVDAAPDVVTVVDACMPASSSCFDTMQGEDNTCSSARVTCNENCQADANPSNCRAGCTGTWIACGSTYEDQCTQCEKDLGDCRARDDCHGANPVQ